MPCKRTYNCVLWPFRNPTCAKDWARKEAPIMRACLVHALILTKRTANAKSTTIQFLKTFISKLLVESGQLISMTNSYWYSDAKRIIYLYTLELALKVLRTLMRPSKLHWWTVSCLLHVICWRILLTYLKKERQSCNRLVKGLCGHFKPDWGIRFPQSHNKSFSANPNASRVGAMHPHLLLCPAWHHRVQVWRRDGLPALGFLQGHQRLGRRSHLDLAMDIT